MSGVQDRPERPQLLTLGMAGSIVVGAVNLIIAFGSILPAATGSGSYSINNRPITAAEFLWRAVLPATVTGAILLAAGFGLLRQRAWARPVMLAFWIAVPAAVFVTNGNGTEAALSASIPSVAVFLVAYWYLYRREVVNAYFTALEHADEYHRS